MSPVSLDCYLLPVALFTPGSLHIIWNSFQEALTGLPLWKSFELRLKSVVDFLRDRGLRQRYQSICLKRSSDKQRFVRLFEHWSEKPVDWRWEKLSTTLQDLVPVLKVLLETYDHQVMSSGVHEDESAQKIAMKSLHKLQTQDSFKDCFSVLAYTFRDIGNSLEHCANWCELCPCHGKRFIGLSDVQRYACT